MQVQPLERVGALCERAPFDLEVILGDDSMFGKRGVTQVKIGIAPLGHPRGVDGDAEGRWNGKEHVDYAGAKGLPTVAALLADLLLELLLILTRNCSRQRGDTAAACRPLSVFAE